MNGKCERVWGMIIAGTMEERQQRRLGKSVPVWKRLVPEELRTPCLKCNGIARKDSISRSHSLESRYCEECRFGWEYDGARMTYGCEIWKTLPSGLLPVFWEKEVFG